MKAVGFYIFYCLIWIITLLPFRILYCISDLLFLILYYFPSYRRDVVATNLRNAFPEKSDREREVIERRFYRHLSDLFVEILKITHLSDSHLMKRCTANNLDIIDRLIKEKRDMVAVLGHYNNWEWLSIIPRYMRLKIISIYKPLQNTYFNKFMNNLRAKYGMYVTPMSFIIRDIITCRKDKVNFLTAFLSDQTPPKGDIEYWTTFLNQDTPVYLGVEKVASKYDMAVVYFDLKKIRRGYYHLNIELLFEHTADLPQHVVTETHVKRLEKAIKDNPEYWLWSHRRWKHKKPSNSE